MSRIAHARFAHTNLVSRDWRSLALFYEQVFGCTPVPPERHYRGRELEAGTGLPGVGLVGAHLRLPGLGPIGPTLEVFQYEELADDVPRAVNRPGFGHIAFAVPDVREARREVLAHGGSAVGEVVDLVTASSARVTWCYVRDPEGNIIELQTWQ